MRKLWLIGLLGLVLVACDVSNPPVPDSDLTAQACSPVISMDRVMQLLNDTRDARGESSSPKPVGHGWCYRQSRVRSVRQSLQW